MFCVVEGRESMLVLPGRNIKTKKLLIKNEISKRKVSHQSKIVNKLKPKYQCPELTFDNAFLPAGIYSFDFYSIPLRHIIEFPPLQIQVFLLMMVCWPFLV